MKQQCILVLIIVTFLIAIYCNLVHRREVGRYQDFVFLTKTLTYSRVSETEMPEMDVFDPIGPTL